MPRIIPIRDLKNTAAISKMCSESKEPIYITKNGYGDMVIMSMKAYEEKMLMLDVYERLAAAEDEVQAGKVQDARAALKELLDCLKTDKAIEDAEQEITADGQLQDAKEALAALRKKYFG